MGIHQFKLSFAVHINCKLRRRKALMAQLLSRCKGKVQKSIKEPLKIARRHFKSFVRTGLKNAGEYGYMYTGFCRYCRKRNKMKPSARYFFYFAFAILPATCGYSDETDPCNPAAGRFIDDTHYIDSSLLTEDGRWDYREWDTHRERLSNYRPGHNCIPIETQKPLSRKLYELEAIVDVQR